MSPHFSSHTKQGAPEHELSSDLRQDRFVLDLVVVGQHERLAEDDRRGLNGQMLEWIHT